MAKPLRSEDPRPSDVSFRDFGVLDTGGSSKSATTTSIVVNVVIASLVLVLGAVVKQTKLQDPNKLKSIALNEPPPPPPPPPVKLPPPPKLPPVPKVELPKIQPPKVELPKPVPLPPDVKPIPVPTPKVNIAPPAPAKVNPPPAPVHVSLASAHAASVPNNDPHPSAVSLGNPNNPMKTSAGPAVSPVNMRAGFAGMPAGNTGNGPHATAVNMGSGSPQGSDLNGRSNAVVPVAGLARGTPGGTGKGTSGPVTVQMASNQAPPASAHAPTVAAVAAGTPPKVTYKPSPAYTEEARNLHLEGNVTLRIRVTSAGAVQVLGVIHGLGHGLDASAEQAAASMRFSPAKDATGHPVDWEGPVTVLFQLS